MKKMLEKESLSAGFWLPCGRASFVNTRLDRKLISLIIDQPHQKNSLADIMEQVSGSTSGVNPLECSVLNRLCHVFTQKHCAFDFVRLIKPEYISGDIQKDDDPEGLYAYAKEISYTPYGNYGALRRESPIKLKNVHFTVDHNGFYFCWLTGEQTEGLDKHTFEAFLIDMLQGWDTLAPKQQGVEGANDIKEKRVLKWDDFPYTVDVEKYSGILTFAQLNLIIEGLNNYFFDPDVFFEHKKVDLQEDLRKEYGLFGFFDSIVTPLKLSSEMNVPDNHVPIGINYLISSTKGTSNIIEEVLRQFLIGTSVNIQSLKWAVEKCRRHLLNEVISEAHRRNEILQIRTKNEQEKQPNSALLKGYVMFLGAKMPILLNVQRHLKAVQKEGVVKSKRPDGDTESESHLLRDEIEIANLNLSELFYSWNSLVHGLNDNVLSIDHAIAQSRQDRILHEQEQIRAEQEASAEAARISERSGTSSIGMDEEASARGANLLALLSILLAGIAFLAQDPSGGSPSLDEYYNKVVQLFSVGHPLVIIFKILFSSLILSVAGFMLQYFFNRILQDFARLWRKLFGLEEVYYYELDARIEEHINSGVRLKIFEGDTQIWREEETKKHGDYAKDDPKYFRIGAFDDSLKSKISSYIKWFLGLSGAVSCQTNAFMMTDLSRKYYRVERSRDDEALHKINFEANMALPKEKEHAGWNPIRIIITTVLCCLIFVPKQYYCMPGTVTPWQIIVCTWVSSAALVLWGLASIPWWWARWKSQCVLCHFTYEFLYHLHSSENNKFVLREMRFVARDFQRPLNIRDTINLKESILNTLIGTWVDAEEFEKLKNRENEPITAFISEKIQS